MKFISTSFFFISVLLMLGGCTSLTITEKKSVKESYDLPVETPDKFIWGINGHPVTTLDYTNRDLATELGIIDEHQFDMYRVDVRTDSLGEVVWYPKRFEELLSMTKEKKLKLLPIIIIDQFIKEYNLSPEEAYALGKKQTQGFVRKYGKYFDRYELGNEQERKIIYPNVNGIVTTDYDHKKFAIVASYLKGMVDAIKHEDPSAKTLISVSWLHWGFYDLLQQAGVHFDIISYHWYSNMGSLFKSTHENVNIIETLISRYGKPIWITEINKKDGSLYGTEEEQAFWVDYFIQELNNQSNIKAFFVYELYDEPNLKDKEWAGEIEANYGIVKWKSQSPKANSFEYKPVSNLLKFRIEESKYGYEDFVAAITRHLNLGGNQEKNIEKLQKTKSKKQIVTQLLTEANFPSAEKTTTGSKTEQEGQDQIIGLYKKFLNRNPSQNEIKYWLKKLKRKNTNISQTILMSREYWENAIWEGFYNRTGTVKN